MGDGVDVILCVMAFNAFAFGFDGTRVGHCADACAIGYIVVALDEHR